MGRRLLFDIESDGLLKAVPSRNIKQNTKVHCIGAVDVDTGEELYWGPPIPPDHPDATPATAVPAGTVAEGCKVLAEADLLLGHNIVGYDLPALEVLVPGWTRPARCWDTLVIAKVVWPVETLMDRDLAIAAKLNMSPKEKALFIKRHSLKAWGIRTGTHKRDYDGGFEAWSPEMAGYMMDDVRSNLALWRLQEKRLGWRDPRPGDLVWPELVIDTENEVAAIIQAQEADGVRFDLEAGHKLSSALSNEKARIERQLVETFGSWWAAGPVHTASRDVQYKRPEFPDVTIRRFSPKTGKELKPYVGPPLEHHYAGALSTPITRTTFNPSSRDHLGQRLQAVFGWKPKKHGANGKPTVDESVLEEIPEAVIPPATRQLILDYFVVNKTLGMLDAGAKAWLRLVTPEGRIHGRLDTAGAITGRGTHSDPNLGQCPSVRKKKVKADDGTSKEVILYGLEGRYGIECRALFTADDGWEQTGVDASALELIDLGHYLQPYDGGKFSERVCDPKRDPHTEHADLTGLTRGDTKTATYLYVYGGSAYKLSLGITVEPHEVPALLTYKGLPALLRSLEKRFDADFVAKLDDTQKAKIAKARQIILAFEGGIEGIRDLKDNVTEAAKRGWLRGMDGRKVIVRKAHAALNALLQSAGAQSCKLWIALTHKKLAALGLKRGVDFKQVLWVHDELQFTHRPGLGPTIKAVAEEAMREAGGMLGLRGVYRTDGKTGRNWAECH